MGAVQTNFRGWDTRHKVMSHDPDLSMTYGALVAPDGWTIMQSSGQVDKNGLAIYEGDILALEDEDDYCVVRRGYLYDDWGNCCHGLHLGTSMPEKYAKILGNIYEHPHILEEVTRKLEELWPDGFIVSGE